ncbi:hypothetical protein [Enterococcus faecium]|uniref:hypothetical protein n=1 Tax=Enterococcus faecium TaxID=1352 RepID=UPI00387E138C
MKKKLFRIVGIVFISIVTLTVLLSLVGTVAEATGLVDDTVEAGNLYSKYSGSIISRTDRKSFYRSLLSMKKQNIQKLR